MVNQTNPKIDPNVIGRTTQLGLFLTVLIHIANNWWLVKY